MESNKKNIAFKIPDNPQMGLGHFIRCFKIAKKIQNKYHIFFITSLEQKLNLKYFKKFPFKFILIDKKKNFIQEFKEINKSKKINTLFIDDYSFNFLKQKKISNLVSKLIILDDSLKRKIYCDYFINYKFDSKKLILSNLKKNNSSIKKKCLLGEEFWIPSFGLSRHFKNKKKYISISFGNSFNFKKIEKFLKKFLVKNNKFHFQIFIGLNCTNYQYLTNLSKKFKNIKIVMKQFIIDKYLNKTFLFIGSSGNSIYEMSYLNIPSLFFSISNNQLNDSASLEKMGHFFHSSINDINEKNLSDFINAVIKNYSRFIRLNRKKKIFLNKKGISKIIDLCKL